MTAVASPPQAQNYERIQALQARLEEAKGSIAERRAWLQVHIGWILELMEKIGKETSRESHSAHTNIVEEIAEFGGFKFKLETGLSMLGGAQIHVWKCAEGSTEVAHTRPVLEIWSEGSEFSIDNITVKVWDDSNGMLVDDLGGVLTTRERILDERRRQKVIGGELLRQEHLLQDEIDRLGKEKIRLGLVGQAK